MEAVEALRDKTLKISQFCLTDDEFRTHIQERFSYVAPEVLDGVYYKESDVWRYATNNNFGYSTLNYIIIV